MPRRHAAGKITERRGLRLFRGRNSRDTKTRPSCRAWAAISDNKLADSATKFGDDSIGNFVSLIEEKSFHHRLLFLR